MINNDQNTLLLYCSEDVKSHRPGGDTVPLRYQNILKLISTTTPPAGWLNERLRESNL